MRKRAIELFDEVADLTNGARARHFDRYRVNEDTRRDVEGLLAFDCPWTTSLQRDLGGFAVSAIAQFQDEDRRCGPYRLGHLLGRSRRAVPVEATASSIVGS